MKIYALAPVLALAAAALLPQQAFAKIINLACTAPTGAINIQLDTDSSAGTLSTPAAPGVEMHLQNVRLQEHLITASLFMPIKGRNVEFAYAIDRTTGILKITVPAFPQLPARQGSCTLAPAAPNKF